MSEAVDKRIGQWFEIEWIPLGKISVCVKSITRTSYCEIAHLYDGGPGYPKSIQASHLRGKSALAAERKQVAEAARESYFNSNPLYTMKPIDTAATIAARKAARAAAERNRREKNNALNREKVKAGIRKHRYAPSVSIGSLPRTTA